jgi:hypothetical protein
MAYEPALDPEDHPGTPEWRENIEQRRALHLAWIDSLSDDYDEDIRTCRRAHH